MKTALRLPSELLPKMTKDNAMYTSRRVLVADASKSHQSFYLMVSILTPSMS
jgi:hypothetical protein